MYYNVITKLMFLILGFELQGTVQEVENLKKEVDNLKHCGETKWRQRPKSWQ